MVLKHAECGGVLGGAWALQDSHPLTCAPVSPLTAAVRCRGLSRGYAAAQLTWVPYFGLYFVVYERLRVLAAAACATPRPPAARATAAPSRETTQEDAAVVVGEAKGAGDVPFAASLVCGFCAGALAAAATCPIDVVKTRIQVGKGSSVLVTSTARGAGGGGVTIRATVQELWRKEVRFLLPSRHRKVLSLLLRNTGDKEGPTLLFLHAFHPF